VKVQLAVGLEEALRVLLGAELALDLDLDPEAEVEPRTLVDVLVRSG